MDLHKSRLTVPTKLLRVHPRDALAARALGNVIGTATGGLFRAQITGPRDLPT